MTNTLDEDQLDSMAAKLENEKERKRKKDPFYDWREHDDINPNTGRFYSEAHQQKVWPGS